MYVCVCVFIYVCVCMCMYVCVCMCTYSTDVRNHAWPLEYLSHLSQLLYMFSLCVFQVSAWNKTPSSDTVSCPIVAILRCSSLQHIS